MNADSPDTPADTSDFHLVEISGGWRLTIRVSDRLLAALREGAEADATGQFTVHVEPNLLPGEPFTATVRVADAISNRAVRTATSSTRGRST